MRKEIILNGIKAVQCIDQETGRGSLHFKFIDTTVEVTDDNTKENTGSIVGCVGGGIELWDKRTDKKDLSGLFFINSESLWNSFLEALKTPKDEVNS